MYKKDTYMYYLFITNIPKIFYLISFQKRNCPRLYIYIHLNCLKILPYEFWFILFSKIYALLFIIKQLFICKYY